MRLTRAGYHFHRVDDNPFRFNFLLTPLNGKQAFFPQGCEVTRAMGRTRGLAGGNHFVRIDRARIFHSPSSSCNASGDTNINTNQCANSFHNHHATNRNCRTFEYFYAYTFTGGEWFALTGETRRSLWYRRRWPADA